MQKIHEVIELRSASSKNFNMRQESHLEVAPSNWCRLHRWHSGILQFRITPPGYPHLEVLTHLHYLSRYH